MPKTNMLDSLKNRYRSLKKKVEQNLSAFAKANEDMMKAQAKFSSLSAQDDIDDRELGRHEANLESVANILANVKKEREILSKKLNSLKSKMGQATIKNRGEIDSNKKKIGGDMKVTEGFTKDPKVGFKNAKEFFMSVMQNNQVAPEDKRLKFLSTKNQFKMAVGGDEHNTLEDQYGGFLMPRPLLGSLEDSKWEPDPLISLSDSQIVSLPSTASNIELPSVVDQDHRTSVSGGLQVYRRQEMQKVEPSRLKLKTVGFNMNGLMGFSYASEELLSDSPISIAALLDRGFNEEFKSKIMQERLGGNGVGQPMGVLHSTNPALISVDRTTANQIKGQDLLNMRKRCWGYQNAIWMANQDAYDSLFKIHLVADGNAGILTMYNQDFRNEGYDRILGRPVVYSEYIDSFTDANGLALVNWSQYNEITMQSMQREESIHVRFEYNERAFRFLMRQDGKTRWLSTLTPKKGSANTISPFVTLK